MIIPGSSMPGQLQHLCSGAWEPENKVNQHLQLLTYLLAKPSGRVRKNWSGDKIILVGKLAIRQPIEQLRHTCVCGCPEGKI